MYYNGIAQTVVPSEDTHVYYNEQPVTTAANYEPQNNHQTSDVSLDVANENINPTNMSDYDYVKC